MARNENTRLVYSTDGGKVSPQKSTPSHAAPADGVVRISRETKGRKGKGMTIITGVTLQGQELKDLAKQLKQKCGTGGTVKNGVIEIQGDHRDTLLTDLSARGWTVKKAGG